MRRVVQKPIKTTTYRFPSSTEGVLRNYIGNYHERSWFRIYTVDSGNSMIECSQSLSVAVFAFFQGWKAHEYSSEVSARSEGGVK